MSALTPHIRVLRAEAKALRSLECPFNGIPSALALAKERAADALEAEERELEERVAGPQVKGH